MLKLEEVPTATQQSREEGSLLPSQAHTKGRFLHEFARRHTGPDMNVTNTATAHNRTHPKLVARKNRTLHTRQVMLHTNMQVHTLTTVRVKMKRSHTPTRGNI